LPAPLLGALYLTGCAAVAENVLLERFGADRAQRLEPLNKRTLVIQALLSFGLQIGVARAAEDSQSAIPEQAQAHARSALCVQIAAGPQPLDSRAVRTAIESELGIDTSSVVTPATIGTVRVEPGKGAFVTVRYESADGGTQLKRRMALPVDPSRRVQVIAWVVGNLVRHEADEILLSMLHRREKPAGDSVALDAPVDTASASAYGASNEPQTTPANAGNATTPKQQISRVAVKPPPAWVQKPSKSADSPNPSPDLGPTRFFHAALFSPTLAWPADAAQHAFRLSLGGVYSKVGALDGVGIGWFVNRVEYHSSGAQLSGLWIDGSEHVGVLVAGLATRSRGALSGAELTGLVTLRSGRVVGAQVTGAGAYAGGGVEGAQLSGVFSYSASEVQGVQLAGGVNIANGDLHGLQISGGVNYQSKHSRGAQITGGVNVATDVDGLQMGLLNVARDVDGLQLGAVNVARDNRGIALGLFNWSAGARLQPTYFYQTPGYHSAGYRTLSGYSTGTISFGYDPSTKRARTHFATGPRYAYDRFAIGAELGYGWVLENMSGAPSDRAHELDLIGTVSVEVIRKLVSVYAGGGVVLPVAGVVAIEPHGLAQAGVSFF